MSVTYTDGYFFTLQRNGIDVIYNFNAHRVGTCVALEVVKNEDRGGLDPDLLSKTAAEDGYIYYLYAEHRVTGEQTWVRLASMKEASCINKALRQLEI